LGEASRKKKAQLVTACLDQATAATAAELVVCVARTDTWRRNRQLILEHLRQRGPVPPQQLNYYGKIVPLFYTPGWLGLLGRVKSVLFSVVGIFRPVPRGPFSKSGLKATLSKTTALAWYLDRVKLVDPAPLGKQRSQYAKDAPYLARALAAGAKLIVTRDDDLPALQKPFGLQIITPRELLAKLAKPI